MPVDLYGLPADYDAIGRIATEARPHRLLRRGAQSFGGRAGNRRVGGTGADLGDELLPDQAARLLWRRRRHPRPTTIIWPRPCASLCSHGRQGTGDVAVRNGITGRLDTLQAAILLAKFEIFEEELARRDAIARRYDAAFSGLIGVQERAGRHAVRQRPLYRDDREPRRAQGGARCRGIGNALFYRVALRTTTRPSPRSTKRPLTASERLAATVLSIPMKPGSDRRRSRPRDRCGDALRRSGLRGRALRFRRGIDFTGAMRLAA